MTSEEPPDNEVSNRVLERREIIDAKRRELQYLTDQEFKLQQSLHYVRNEQKREKLKGDVLLNDYIDICTKVAKVKAEMEYRDLTAQAAVSVKEDLADGQMSDIETKRQMLQEAIYKLQELKSQQSIISEQLRSDLENYKTDTMVSLETMLKSFEFISRQVETASSTKATVNEQTLKVSIAFADEELAEERARARQAIYRHLLDAIRKQKSLMERIESDRLIKDQALNQVVDRKMFSDPSPSDYQRMDDLLEEGLRHLRSGIQQEADFSSSGAALYRNRKDRLREVSDRAGDQGGNSAAVNVSVPAGVRTNRSTMIRHATMKARSGKDNSGSGGDVSGAMAAFPNLAKPPAFGTSAKGRNGPLERVEEAAPTDMRLAARLTAMNIGMPVARHEDIEKSVVLGSIGGEFQSVAESSSYFLPDKSSIAAGFSKPRGGKAAKAKDKQPFKKGGIILKSVEQILSIVEKLRGELSAFCLPGEAKLKRRLKPVEREMFISQLPSIMALQAELEGDVVRLQAVREGLQCHVLGWASILSAAWCDLKDGSIPDFRSEDETSSLANQNRKLQKIHFSTPSVVFETNKAWRQKLDQGQRSTESLDLSLNQPSSSDRSAFVPSNLGVIKEQDDQEDRAHQSRELSSSHYVSQLTMESVEIEKRLWKLHDNIRKINAPRCCAAAADQWLREASQQQAREIFQAQSSPDMSVSNPISVSSFRDQESVPTRQQAESFSNISSFIERLFCSYAELRNVGNFVNKALDTYVDHCSSEDYPNNEMVALCRLFSYGLKERYNYRVEVAPPVSQLDKESSYDEVGNNNDPYADEFDYVG